MNKSVSSSGKNWWLIVVLLIISVHCSHLSPQKVSSEKSAGLAAESWSGTYTGLVPCADCGGVMTTLVLSSSGRYQLTRQYLKGDESSTSESEGNFNWSDDGRSVTLSGISGSPSVFFVDSNGLVQADINGNRVTGPLAGRYLLHREGDVAPDESITGKRWLLVELNGKPVGKAAVPRQQIHLVMNNDDKRVTGSAGCNNFFGTFELHAGHRIRFDKLISTKMACPEPLMTTEQDFLKMLESVDNYSAGDSLLILSKAKMAPLARFRKD